MNAAAGPHRGRRAAPVDGGHHGADKTQLTGSRATLFWTRTTWTCSRSGLTVADAPDDPRIRDGGSSSRGSRPRAATSAGATCRRWEPVLKAFSVVNFVSMRDAERRWRWLLAASGPPTWPKPFFFFFFVWSGHRTLTGPLAPESRRRGVASGGDVLAHTRLRREAGSRWDALAAGRATFEAAEGLVGAPGALLDALAGSRSERLRGPAGQPSHPRVGRRASAGRHDHADSRAGARRRRRRLVTAGSAPER